MMYIIIAIVIEPFYIHGSLVLGQYICLSCNPKIRSIYVDFFF